MLQAKKPRKRVGGYYPFGMSMDGAWMNDLTANDKPYQYNGKELESFGGLGWYDYGARYYDASVGRWGHVDPMSEVIPNHSPYAYVYNNPIMFVDPDGRLGYVYDSEKKTYIQVSNDGGDETDFIYQGSVSYNDDGTVDQVAYTTGGAQELSVNKTFGFGGFGTEGMTLSRGPGQMRASLGAASGSLATLDGFDDPIFNVITLGQGAALRKASTEGLEVLGFSAFKFGGDNLASTAGNSLLGTARDNFISAVQNLKLKNIVNDLYRQGAKVGSGSSMDAFRLEQLTGGKVGGKTHTIKLLQYRTALQRLWENRASLSAGDRQITKQLLNDIQNALSGK